MSNLPPVAQGWFSQALGSGLYDDSPYLNGMVCVALATGIAKDCLRGRYFDVGQDLEDVLAQREVVKKEGDSLYMLHTSFLGGVGNAGVGGPSINLEGGKGEGGFEFPGF